MLNREKLSVHHVGGMNGARSFPIIESFEKDIINVLYEANEEEIEGIYKRNNSLQSELHVIPYCVWKTEEKIHFNLMRDRHTSSVYELDSYYKDYNCTFFHRYDYELGDVFQTEKQVEVEAFSLDYLYKNNKMKTPPIDFLSLDTQGSEFEILDGAKESLDEVLGIVTEVEFLSVYKGQKSFGAISDVLISKGFHLVNMFDYRHVAPKRTPLGLRGPGFIFSVDILYLKDPLKIVSTSKEDKIIKLKKLAFISIIYGQVELADLCFDLLIEEDGLDYWPKSQSSSYNDFILEFYGKSRSFKYYPPAFSDYCNSNGTPKKLNTFDKLKLSLFRPFHNILRKLPIVKVLYYRGFVNCINILFFNDLEKLLVKHGLKEVGKDLRRRRCQNKK